MQSQPKKSKSGESSGTTGSSKTGTTSGSTQPGRGQGGGAPNKNTKEGF